MIGSCSATEHPGPDTSKCLDLDGKEVTIHRSFINRFGHWAIIRSKMELQVKITIEDHPNYGKDVHRVQREMSILIGPKLRLFRSTLKMLIDIRREIGVRRLIKMLGNVKQRVEESIGEYNFSSVRASTLATGAPTCDFCYALNNGDTHDQ